MKITDIKVFKMSAPAWHKSETNNWLFVKIYTDSMYLQQGITSWINKWKLNNWRTSSKKEVKNSDLWKRLDDLSNTLNVSWNWVKAHSGHPENERADFLANKGILLK